MHCLQINKFWHRRGGADVYAMDVAAGLAAQGNTVSVLSTAHPGNDPHPDAWAWPPYFELGAGGRSLGSIDRGRAALRVVYNAEAARSMERLLEARRPDIAHLHNFTRHLSPSILLVARRAGLPVIATLHDHWPTCPAYSLLKPDGTRCEWECRDRGPQRCLRHRCIAGRRGASALAALEYSAHRWLGWGLELIDIAIAPSRFLAESLGPRQTGACSVRVVPHPRPRHEWVPPPRDGTRQVLYVGRLAREKGVEHLLAATSGAPWELCVAGTGPEEPRLRALARDLSNVRFLGHLSGERVVAAMRAAHVIVVPSVWYENAPLVVLEALAVGRPVVASRIGGIPEYCPEALTSLLVPPGDGDALRGALEQVVLAEPAALTEMARAAWTASAAAPGWPEHLGALEAIYREAHERRA